MATTLTSLSPLAESSSPPPIDFLSPTSIQSAIAHRRTTLQRDIESLTLLRDELMRAQKEGIVQGLCKLNKDVKKLTVKEFNGVFGCDVVEMVRKQMAKGDVVTGGGGKRSYPKGGVAGGLALKTPAAVRFGKPPMTRTVRRGERVVS